MGIKPTKVILLSLGLTVGLAATSACVPSKIQKEIESTEKKNEEIKEERKYDNVEEIPPEEIELSPEQQEVLDELTEITPQEALNHNILEERTESEGKAPRKKDIYTNETEFSQYISFYFYQFHSNKIDADEFYDAVSPYFHNDFIDKLPVDEDARRRTFEILQEQFQIHLPSVIESYWITNVDLDPRSKEGTFYRVYELKNKQLVHYVTYIRPSAEGGWLITDDRPGPPYKIKEAIENKVETEEEE